MLLLKFYNIKYASERQAQSLKYHLIFFPTFEVKVLEKVNYKPISKKKVHFFVKLNIPNGN